MCDRNSRSRFIGPIVVLCIIALLTGCARSKTPRDPFEKYNRVMYKVNKGIDTVVFRPLAKGYKFITPWFVRDGVDNFFDNFMEPRTFVSNLLQGRPGGAIKSFWRFTLNTTFGIGGLLDVAKYMGFPHAPQDFGLVFAHWGDKDSPYFVLPILGPSTVRDAYGLYFGYFATPYPYIEGSDARSALFLFHLIHLRMKRFDTDEIIKEAALDEYTFVRDAYLQNRDHEIRKNDGTADDDTFVDGNEGASDKTAE